MIGVIIARLQTPYLHPGHIGLIESVKAKHRKVVIILGVSPVLGSKRNPLDFPTREKMIKKSFPEIIVLPLPDHPLDTTWSTTLDTLLTNTFPGASFALYGSRDSFIDYYSGKNVVVEIPAQGQHNATQLREFAQDETMDSMEFRSGIIYAYANTYNKVYPTVDIAVFRNNRAEILLGKKDIDQKWRLIGGFSDPTDESFECAALRELREECGDITVAPMQYETSLNINDWRYQRETDKIITTLFSTNYISGTPVANDDLAELNWFKLNELSDLIKNNLTTPTHTPLLNTLITKYTK
ncbi:NUDIX domain-containing protein [Pseudochryseolinea flava]|uniref:NUDIX hydrolase n=1 Tax=Pseudochryseolinea flava TaxID=2059302 RepID=A0A364Y666_9BACT|nr:NUDIX domain-containing protein [Pseudochryseolinea flava]RAW02332.1 NUDIX hydrolase [Pseudochryseolinea flava]